MYNIFIIESAQKDLRSLPKHEASAISEKIQTLSTNPRPQQSAKLKGAKDAYRLRKGKYRITYTIDDSKGEITIYSIRHRKDIYRYLF